jgi:PIN domain nuclease of toxin-antitoxin system
VRLLLDTHIWLWASLEPARLPAWIGAALAASDNELWLSPLSGWELAQLCRKGRLQLDRPWAEWLTSSARAAGLRDAALSAPVVLAADRVRVPHRDPVDWLLAATARHYDLALVTLDAQLLAGSGFARLARPA